MTKFRGNAPWVLAVLVLSLGFAGCAGQSTEETTEETTSEMPTEMPADTMAMPDTSMADTSATTN